MSFQEFGEVIEEENVPSGGDGKVAEFGEVIELAPENSHGAGARALKGAVKGLGSYGDILDLVRAQGKERLTPGQEALYKAESEAPESLLPFLQDDDILPRFSRIGSSQEIGEAIEKHGGPAAPQTFKERVTEYGPEFFTSLAAFGGTAPAKTPLAKAAKSAFRALVPASVAAGGESANLPPWMQAAATISSGLLAHGLTGKSLRELNSATYQKANSFLPKKARTNAKPLYNSLTKLGKEMRKGALAPSEKAVLDFTQKALKKIDGGKIKVDELAALKRSASEYIGLNELRKQPRARNLLKKISRDLNATIKEYGEGNPQYYKYLKEADSAHRGMNEASVIERFIRSNPLLSTHGGVLTHYLFPALSIKGALVGAPFLKAAEVGAAIARNPGLRKLYFKVLKDASKGSVNSTLKGLQAFDKRAREELSPDFFEEEEIVES